MQPRAIAEDYLGTINRDGLQVSLQREDLLPLIRERCPDLGAEAQQDLAAKALDEIQGTWIPAALARIAAAPTGTGPT